MFSAADLLYILHNNYKKLLIYISTMLVLQLIITFGILVSYASFIDHQLNNNIIEYEEIDIVQLCNIANCKSVRFDQMELTKDQDGFLRRTETPEISTFEISGIKITSVLDIIVFNSKSNASFLLDTDSLTIIMVKTVSYVTLFLIIVSILLMAASIKEEKEQSIRTLAGNEALLANKSIILITENIHHELNSPLEVIESKIHKIHKYFEDSNGESLGRREVDKNAKLFSADFDLISQSTEQIYNVLSRMKGFKNIKYSNGNKSIADIIEGAFNVISNFNTNFEFYIDPELSKYSINSSNLKNADLLNILINHIKNSLEANASKITFMFAQYEHNRASFHIIDNGFGINESVCKDIFKPNFSTKAEEDKVRGNGLYLNKSILTSANGNVYIAETSPLGTAFEIIVPAILRVAPE